MDILTTGQTVLRGVKPEALVTIDGLSYEVGGLKGQPNYAYLAREWLDQMQADPRAMRLVGFEVGQPAERFPWKRVRHHSPDAVWPPKGVSLRFDYAPPDEQRKIRVAVYYELYDGIPLMSKWITVHNPTEQTITVDRFTSEILAVVEHASWASGVRSSSEKAPSTCSRATVKRSTKRFPVALAMRWMMISVSVVV